jgi:hypothetical protein
MASSQAIFIHEGVKREQVCHHVRRWRRILESRRLKVIVYNYVFKFSHYIIC